MKLAWALAGICAASTVISGCASNSALIESLIEPSFQTISASEVPEPGFVTTGHLQFEIAYLFSSYSGGYVAVLANDDQTHCLDILAEDVNIADELERFDEYPQVLYDTMPARFILTVDAEAEIPASRASYQFWDGEDRPIISSSAWYLRDGEQRFLVCPQSTYNWRVYRVSAVEEIDSHSSAE